MIAFIHGRIPVLWLAGLLALPATGGASAAVEPTWVIRTWQSDAGLPDNTVVGIEQTPDGFLWVATRTGLVRFDGVRFQPFPVTVPGVPAGEIKALVADRRARLWVAKDRGVVICLDQGRATTVVGPEHAAADIGASLMVEDAAGAVWVSYGNGEVLRIQDGRVRAFTTADGLPEGAGMCRLALDGTGQLWFSKGSWVGVFRGDKFRPLEQVDATAITGARSGGIWWCRDAQFWKYCEGRPLLKIPANLPVATPTALHEDRAGCLWVGTVEAGLFRFDPAGPATTTVSQPAIVAMKEDREGNLWIGTRGGGLNQLKPKIVDLLTPGSASPFSPVRSVCQDTDGVLWAVVWPNGEVLRSAGQGWTPLSAKDGWLIPFSQCVAADPQGGIWIGTQYAGLHRWRNGVVTDSLNKTSGLAGDHVEALLATASGEVWIGTGWSDKEHEDLQCRKAGQLQTFHLPPGSGLVRALATDSAGDCWAATSQGLLLRVRDDVLTNETGSTLAEPCEIRCLSGSPDGSLWIGYGGQGLGRLKAGRFSRCRMDQGLHDDYISNILPDGHGLLWLAGNRGIFSVREKELDDLAEGRATRVWSVAYGRNDGLSRLQASYDAWPGAARGTDGRLWFAMQSGVAVVNPGDLKENPESPPVVIERVSVNGKTVAAYGAGGLPKPLAASAPLELSQGTAHLRLSPGQRRVEFFFTAPVFTKPEIIGFKYRLFGLDTDWVDGGVLRSATYAQVPPGHYRFQVRACNSDGVWNETGAALDLTAEPHWWETAWFRVLAPLAAAGLLGGGILLGLRRRHRRQIERLKLLQATDRERARIARDLHDDLGSHLTRIVMLSDAEPDGREDAQEVGGALDEINQTGREMTLKMSEIVWALNPEHDTLDSFAGYVAKRAHELLAAAKIQCRLDLPLDLPAGPLSSPVRHEVLLAFKEALHNIVKHARATSVLVTLRLEGESFMLTVEDDGQGFVVPPDASSRGHGLANMQHRLAAVDGRCEVRSQPGDGTCVRFDVPLATRH
ncbi:MAG: triple tyrosine motif-containing protein [Verrucomicrobia bacterium]|nr:triple tyrosine motif-containing protein [Verrucomicrobiota bacterium]